MLLKSTVAAATLALAAAIAPPAHAIDVPLCTATATQGRSTCTFVGPPHTYRVSVSGSSRYAWAEAVCPFSSKLRADAWDTEGGFDSEVGQLVGGQCTLTVAADGGTSTGIVYLVVP